MSDFGDIASEQQEYLLDAALHKHRNKKRLVFTGRCLNCNEKISVGYCCDEDCREDYEKRERFTAGSQQMHFYDEDTD